MDELEFYHGKWTGQQIDDTITTVIRDGLLKFTFHITGTGTQQGGGTQWYVSPLAPDYDEVAQITDEWLVIGYEISTPAAVWSDITISIGTNSVWWNGTFNGSTDLIVYVAKPGNGRTASDQ